MSKILMYGTPTCGDCVLAKQVFDEKNIDYDYIDMLIRDKLMLGKKGETTYIVIDNEN